MHRLLIIILLPFSYLTTEAQGCIENLEKVQAEFYAKNKPFLEYKRIYDSAYQQIIGPERRVMDSLESSAMPHTKYDLVGVGPYYNLLLAQLYKSSYFTEKIKKRICVGGVPAKNFNAFADTKPGGSVVIIDLLLNAYIAPLAQVGALTQAYDSLPYKLETLRKQGNPGFKYINERVPVVKYLDSIMEFYSAEDWIQPPIGPKQSPELFAVTHGCELFIVAHECAHAILEHSGADILRSQVWKQELDADWLGQMIFEDAVSYLPNNEEYKRNMKNGSVLAMVLFSILERETNYRRANIDLMQEELTWLPIIADYISIDNKTNQFVIDTKINLISEKDYLITPPIILRANHLITRIRQKVDYDKAFLEFIIKMGSDLNLIWMLSKSGFYK